MRQSNLHLVDLVGDNHPRPSLADGVAEALIVCDDTGAVSYINAQAERLLAMDADAASGLSVASLLPLEALDGASLDVGLLARSVCRQGTGGWHEECLLPADGGKRIPLLCELIVIAPAAVLILLRPDEAGAGKRSLAYRATHDALTGLPNRACLQERLANLHRLSEQSRALYSLLLLDLDHFKIVNDRFGHAMGDQVLAQVGRRIAHKVRDQDTVGRWGGEEFLCLLPQVDRALAEEIAERIRANLEVHPVEHEGRQIRVSASIGVATYPDDGLHQDALLAKADAALYEAKRAGRNRVQSVTRHAANVFALAHIIEQALNEDRVLPAYQAVVELSTGEVRAAEALARIQLDDRQVMEAAYFIPAAERLHLVHLVDHRIIQAAISSCVTKALGGGPLEAMFVNFSTDFLRYPKLVADILDTIRQGCAMCGDRVGEVKPLVVEITERQFMEDRTDAAEILKPFLDIGLRLAIDDFGAGYSSLKYLAELPVSFIKLEGDLVRRVTKEPRVRAVVQGIRDLAADLGVITVAEGIEDARTHEALVEIGVDWGQGYHFSRPSLHF